MGHLVNLALCLAVLAVSPWAYGYSNQINKSFTTSGASMTFTFNNLPVPAGSTINVDVDLYGDYANIGKYADVTIDGKLQAPHPGGTGCSTTADSKTYSVAASNVSDKTLEVVVANSSTVGAGCTSPNRVDVRVYYNAKPDLDLLNTLKVPNTGTTNKAGDTFTAQYQISCYHDKVNTDFHVQIRHCPAQSGTGCVPVGQEFVTANFTPGETKLLTTSDLVLPNSVKKGDSYIEMTVDATSLIEETVESNNVAYALIKVTAQPDLYASNVTLPTSSVKPGTTFTVVHAVSNALNTSAVDGTFILTYALCDNATGVGCKLLTQQSVTGLLESGSAVDVSSPALLIPSTWPEGTAYLKVTVDSSQLIAEADESNNERLDPFTVGDPGDGGVVYPDTGMHDAGDGGTPLVDGAASGDVGWMWPDLGPQPDLTVDSGETGGGGGSGCSLGGAHRPAGPWMLVLLPLLALLRRRRG